MAWARASEVAGARLAERNSVSSWGGREVGVRRAWRPVWNELGLVGMIPTAGEQAQAVPGPPQIPIYAIL